MNGFSIDLEDWFHILDIDNEYTHSGWENLDTRVEENTDRLLSILDHHKVKCTFFVLGWIADRFPKLVKKIDSLDHEIASHGYWHKLAYEQTPDEFRSDIRKSKCLLEDITGKKVYGYRVPGFSITGKNLWAFDVISEEGYIYDSSVFPASRGHGGLKKNVSTQPYKLSSGIWELPISTIRLFRFNIAYSGGGYLRFFPYSLIKWALKKNNKKNIPAIVYLHPRDIDPNQPKLKMPVNRYLKSYINLRSTEKKINILLKDFKFTKMIDLVNQEAKIERRVICS